VGAKFVLRNVACPLSRAVSLQLTTGWSPSAAILQGFVNLLCSQVEFSVRVNKLMQDGFPLRSRRNGR